MAESMDAVAALTFLNRELFTMIDNRIPLELLSRLLSSQLVTRGDKHLLDRDRTYFRLLHRIVRRGQEKGELRADITARLVYVNGERVDMSPKEYDLFFYMLKNRNIALSREKLITEVWGYDFYGDDRTLDTHIKLLRKTLGEYARLIVTLRGVGYRFEK